MRVRMLALGVLTLTCVLSIVWGPRSGLQWYRLRQAQNQLGTELARLEAEKTKLEQSISSLESNPFIQTKVIQDVLGFLPGDSVLFQFVTPRP